MKAERRHQLQNNALAQHLETFPEMLKRQASKIMLAITAILVVIFIMRYRTNAAQSKQAALAEAMFQIRQGPRALRMFDSQNAPIDNIVRNRAEAVTITSNAIDTVLREADGSDGAALRAEALVARGNLNWTLANLMKLPGSATQPSLALPRPESDYLKSAEDAYRDVISAYSDQILAWTSAQLGLAAIAENRHDWEAAKQAYIAVASNQAVPAAFRDNASGHLRILPQISQPLFLGNYPATAPSSQPTTAPTTQPMSAHLSAPTTVPSTQPTR
jgi:hypothetical protein